MGVNNSIRSSCVKLCQVDLWACFGARVGRVKVYSLGVVILRRGALSLLRRRRGQSIARCRGRLVPLAVLRRGAWSIFCRARAPLASCPSCRGRRRLASASASCVLRRRRRLASCVGVLPSCRGASAWAWGVGVLPWGVGRFHHGSPRRQGRAVAPNCYSFSQT